MLPGIYCRKIELLSEALCNPQEHGKTTAAIGDRGSDQVDCDHPGLKHGQMDAMLHGDLGMILEWTSGQGQKNETSTPLEYRSRWSQGG